MDLIDAVHLEHIKQENNIQVAYKYQLSLKIDFAIFSFIRKLCNVLFLSLEMYLFHGFFILPTLGSHRNTEKVETYFSLSLIVAKNVCNAKSS